MEIAIFNEQNEEVIIAGASDDLFEDPNGLSPSGGPVIQKIMPLRAASPRWVNRGLMERTIPFTVARGHANLAQASMFRLMHAELLNYVGLIRFRARGGGETEEAWSNGVINQVGGVQIKGLTTITSYELKCGQITTAKPD
jgi:hypothetical protein